MTLLLSQEDKFETNIERIYLKRHCASNGVITTLIKKTLCQILLCYLLQN